MAASGVDRLGEGGRGRSPTHTPPKFPVTSGASKGESFNSLVLPDGRPTGASGTRYLSRYLLL